MIFQDDGNLVVYRTAGRQFVWGLNLVPDLNLGAIANVMMSQEGELIAVNNQWGSLWASPSSDAVPGSYASITDGGTLEVRRPDATLAWSSDGKQPEPPLEVVEETAQGESAQPQAVGALALEPGEALKPGEFYDAGNNAVVLPEDGNLSIYAADRETFKWALNQVDNVRIQDVAEVRSAVGGSIEVLDGKGDRLWTGALVLEDETLKVRNERGGLEWEDGSDDGGHVIEVLRPMYVKVPGIVRMAAYSIHDEQRKDPNEADLWFVNIDGDKGNLTQGGAQVLRVQFLGNGKIAFLAASGPHAGSFLIAYDDHVAFEKEINSSAVFHVRAPLEHMDAGFVSFESEAFPGEYLRHQNYKLKLDKASYFSESLLRRDATFRMTAVE